MDMSSPPPFPTAPNQLPAAAHLITAEAEALRVAEARGLDRHWRNLRTHSVHDANKWRYHAVGAHLLSGALPGKPVRKLRAQG